MLRKIVLLLPLLFFSLGRGKLFNFHAIQTRHSFEDSELLCQGLGYDGLAVVSSPEMHVYALSLTETLRASGRGFFIGIGKNSDTHLVKWDDGTFPAEDTPWTRSSNYTGYTFAHRFMISSGGLYKALVNKTRTALCGYHANLSTEANGVSHPGQHAVDVSSSLSVTKVFSYLECVLLCGQDHRCRAAEFNSELLTCMKLGPGSYTGLVANINSQMFVRNGFIELS
ncbi:hypothetical protein ElyMa_002892700 [Elysia marginata]|uniref:C-type lectin domain-containing protein n=1 Tax=Elysia marginata TaxID=1093978 RepID=A0AAV4I3E1_9GAST|nr:hypothetical protein ElyMa_002892700 [Elysia marginata]